MTMLLQTMLFIPGSDERKLEKLPALQAPAFILDLEDAVAVSAKTNARHRVGRVVRSGTSRPLYVRVNSLKTELTYPDIDFVVDRGLSGLVIPKVESASDVALVDGYVSRLERERDIAPGSVELIATIETAAGVHHAVEIASSVKRLRCLAFGAGDFCLDLGLEWPSPDGRLSEVVIAAKVAIVMASRLAGLEPPHDGVFPKFQDLEGLRQEAEQARSLGFYGKHCIHPSQVEVIKRVFTPTSREVAQARAIVAAFDESERSGQAALQLEGVLIDYPVAERARRLLQLAESVDSHRG